MRAALHFFTAAAASALLVLALPVAAQASAAAPMTAAPAEYRMGAGDVLRINVFQNPDLTLETRLTDAGLVSAKNSLSVKADFNLSCFCGFPV